MGGGGDPFAGEIKRFADRIELVEREIRRLRIWRQEVGTGTGLRAGAVVGVIQPGQGGTGSVLNEAGSADLWNNATVDTLVPGDVVIAAAGNDANGTTQRGSAYAIGVVAGPASAPPATLILVKQQGYIAALNTQGPVAVDDYLRTSATVYRAESAGPQPGEGTFARALSSHGAGAGTVAAYLLGHAFDLPAVDRPLTIIAPGVTPVPWAAMPAVSTEFLGLSQHRIIVDTTLIANVKLVVNVVAPGFAGSKLGVQYSDDNGATWADLDPPHPYVPIDAAGVFIDTTVPDYIASFDALARFRLVGVGGNGVITPTFGLIALMLQ